MVVGMTLFSNFDVSDTKYPSKEQIDGLRAQVVKAVGERGLAMIEMAAFERGQEKGRLEQIDKFIERLEDIIEQYRR